MRGRRIGSKKFVQKSVRPTREDAQREMSNVGITILVDEKKGTGMPETMFAWQINPVRIDPRSPLALAARGGGRRAFSGQNVSLSAN